jgi:hypothetical protein
MSTEKKTDPSNERSQPSPAEVNKKKQSDELSSEDLDRATGGSGADRPIESRKLT